MIPDILKINSAAEFKSNQNIVIIKKDSQEKFFRTDPMLRNRPEILSSKSISDY
jgi:hypothetical protein